MRRTTTMAMLVCGLTLVPQRADASLWTTLVDLTESSFYSPPALRVDNQTGCDIRIRIWSNTGEYGKRKMPSDATWRTVVWSNSTWFAVEAAVWNASKGNYIVMDYAEYPWGTNIVFYKYARGDFRLGTWHLR